MFCAKVIVVLDCVVKRSSGMFLREALTRTIGVRKSDLFSGLRPAVGSGFVVAFCFGGSYCGCNLGDAGDTSDVVSALPRPATGTPESKVIWYGCVRAYICAYVCLPVTFWPSRYCEA